MGVTIVAVLIGGCATPPTADELRATSLSFKRLEHAPPVRDGRAEFRDAFCAAMRDAGQVADGDPRCSHWLWGLPDEPVTGTGPLLGAADPERLAIFLVTGAFSECVGGTSRPFATGAARWRDRGATVETIVVGGRSGTARNAQQIAAAMERAPIGDDRSVIVVGYSKGTLDVLRFLVDFPELAGRVDAVIGVASPIFGSPLADTAEPTYAALLAKLPYDKCPPGDGEVIASLRPEVATQWISGNALPARIRYYSLVAFTTREHVARMLVPAWRTLNRTDPRNDGQVIAADAVIPGSTLLGYVNADHWGVAQEIEIAHPFMAGRRDPSRFPLEQLFDAMLQYVAADLRDRTAPLL